MTNQKYGTITFPCFTNEQVKEINIEIKKNILDKQDPRHSAGKVSKLGEFFIVPCSPLLNCLHPWLNSCQQVNREQFGYDIYWDFHLEGFNYNVYGVGGEYGWHIDAKPALLDIKLTLLLNLSEESYEGGEFCTINQTEKIKFDSGMALITNSLIAHKVTPITKGERITLTYWCLGPSWK